MNAPRILVIRFGRLGDVILTAAATRELSRAYPGYSIDFVVRQSLAEAAELLPGVTRVIPLASGSLAAVAALRAGPLAGQYEIVLDLQGNLKSRLLAFITGAAGRSQSASYPKHTLRRRMLVWGRGRSFEGEPVWRRYLHGVEKTGVRVVHDPPRIRPVKATGFPGAVAFAPGAGRETKRWPADRFAEAARRVAAEFDLPVILLGSAGEKKLLEGIASACGVDVRIAAGGTIEKAAAVLRDAAVLVTNDSGLLHLAESAGTPVIALFGPTVAGFGFAPSHPASIVLESDISCRPCSLHGGDNCPIPAKGHACMKEIEPDHVVNAVAGFVK